MINQNIILRVFAIKIINFNIKIKIYTRKIIANLIFEVVEINNHNIYIEIVLIKLNLTILL